MIVTPLGREIKSLRASCGLTVRELAVQLQKSVAYVGKIESQGEIPNAPLIIDLARIFNADARHLLHLAKQSLTARYEKEVNRKYVAPAIPCGVAGSRTKLHHEQKDTPMATTLCLINMKGGVGKTTLAAQLAHAADRVDLKVLAVDLDPQSNLSQSLMGTQDYVAHLKGNKPTVVQIFEDYVPASGTSGSPRRLEVDKLILKNVGYWTSTTLDLIPSRLELSRSLKNPTGKERRLAKALAQVQDQYDLILIDCAPTESIVTEAAYFASRYIVVPIKPEFMATIGLPLLARSLKEFQLENEDHEIEIAGIVFNHSSSYSSGPEGQQSIKEVTDIAAEEGWYVCENQVRYSASYAKSAREGTPIGRTSYVRTGVTEGFSKLKDEIFSKIGLATVKA